LSVSSRSPLARVSSRCPRSRPRFAVAHEGRAGGTRATVRSDYGAKPPRRVSIAASLSDARRASVACATASAFAVTASGLGCGARASGGRGMWLVADVFTRCCRKVGLHGSESDVAAAVPPLGQGAEPCRQTVRRIAHGVEKASQSCPDMRRQRRRQARASVRLPRLSVSRGQRCRTGRRIVASSRLRTEFSVRVTNPH